MKINKITNSPQQIAPSFGTVGISILTKEEAKLLNNIKQQHNYSQSKSIQWGIKQIVDKTHAAVGLILTAPIILLSVIALKLESKGPAFFTQERLGIDGKPFKIFKLRTMYHENKQKDFDIDNEYDPHITKVGKILRKFSIDEFPQFLNILKGDMSLIGPRPITERTHQIRKNDFSDGYLIRYAVKPGASLPYKKTKCKNDNDTINVEKDYVENWNLGKDFKTFLQIIKTVLSGNNY